jgi:5'-nucleotidase
MRKTRIVGALAGSACLVLGSTAATAIASEDDPRPLQILLTNDDGWNAPGITAVHEALVEAGHDVVLVAPASNQSGKGAAVTFGGSLTVSQPEPGKYSVQGTPVDAAEFGLSAVFDESNPPDLVISGTNVGENVAEGIIHSGTVGAAVNALADGVPAIAVSTEVDRSNAGPFAETGQFVVRLVDGLQDRAPRGDLLPDGIGLNVNYPLVDDGGEPDGVTVTEAGRGLFDLDYAGTLPAVGGVSPFTFRYGLGLAADVRGSDLAALEADLVSISPIEADYDAGTGELRWVRGVIQDLGRP